MVRSCQAAVEMYKRLAPLQEKVFRHMEREIDDIEESDSWKYGDADEDQPGEDDAQDAKPPWE